MGCSSSLKHSDPFVKQPNVCVDRWYGYEREGGCPSVAVAKAAAPDPAAARLAALEQDRQLLTEDLEAARRQNEALSNRVGDVEGQLSASNIERDQLASELAALQSGAAAAAIVSSDLAASNQRVADLERQLADRDKELAGLRGELSEETEKLKQAERGLLRALRPEVAKGDITVDLNSERLLINLASGYLFGSGEAQVKPAGVDALKQVGAILQEYPQYKVAVGGHTDNQPIGGALKKKYPTNKELSEARANSAAQALRDGGLTSDLSASGYGESNPVASNKTAEGRAKNRRVEVIVTQ
jgi:chemotaxis protein MotB